MANVANVGEAMGDIVDNSLAIIVGGSDDVEDVEDIPRGGSIGRIGYDIESLVSDIEDFDAVLECVPSHCEWVTSDTDFVLSLIESPVPVVD